ARVVRSGSWRLARLLALGVPHKDKNMLTRRAPWWSGPANAGGGAALTVRKPSGDERRRMMRPALRGITMSAAVTLLAGTAGAQGAKPLKKCPADSVVSGTVCMDTYEASVWRVPGPTTINKSLVSKIQQGKATAADLAKGGATQLGVAGHDYAPCAD